MENKIMPMVSRQMTFLAQPFVTAGGGNDEKP